MLYPPFSRDDHPVIVKAHLWDVDSTSEGPEIVVLLQHHNGRVCELQVLDLQGRLLNAEPLWHIGRMVCERFETGPTPAIWLLGESLTGSWFLPELAGFEENWRSTMGIARYPAVLCRVPLNCLHGLIGPIPPAHGTVATGIQTWFRTPSARELAGLIITIKLNIGPSFKPVVTAQVEERPNLFATSPPITVPVRLGGSPGDDRDGSATVSFKISRVEFTPIDALFAQEVAARVLSDMTYLSTPEDLRRMYHFAHQSVMSRELLDRAPSNPIQDAGFRRADE